MTMIETIIRKVGTHKQSKDCRACKGKGVCGKEKLPCMCRWVQTGVSVVILNDKQEIVAWSEET